MNGKNLRIHDIIKCIHYNIYIKPLFVIEYVYNNRLGVIQLDKKEQKKDTRRNVKVDDHVKKKLDKYKKQIGAKTESQVIEWFILHYEMTKR